MDLKGYTRVLRRRWRLIVLSVALGAVAASVLTMLTPHTYQSTVGFFVSAADNSSNAQLASGGTFTQQRVKSYVQVLKTPRALDPVVHATGIGTSAELAGKVSAVIPPDSVLLDVSVVDRSAQQAQALAAGIASTFPGTIEDLEAVNGDSPVKVTVVKAAVLPTAPISPNPTRNLALGLVLGGLIGLGLAVVRDLLDTKIRTKEDLEQVTGATILGAIPFDEEAAKHPLVLHADPSSRRSEALRTLRTNLQFVDVASHPSTIVVTSSITGEGKSSTCANLAVSLAESSRSVCLIEADLRRPRLLEHLGLAGGVGLTDVLIGRHSVLDMLQPYGQLPLDVLGAGAIPPNPSELLGSTAMTELLADLAARYDFVLLDTPPLLPVTDAAVLTTAADGVILIVGSSLVARDQLTEALDNLAAVNANLLGLVANRLPRQQTHGYYDYQYTANSPTSVRVRRRKENLGLPGLRSHRGTASGARRPADRAGAGAARSSS